MIPMPAGMRIWVACGATDMRRGFDGLAMMVQDVLKKSPYCGHMFVFRGKRADRIKILWWDGTGLCLYAKPADARGSGGADAGAIVDAVRGN
jgi:transposase